MATRMGGLSIIPHTYQSQTVWNTIEWAHLYISTKQFISTSIKDGIKKTNW
jgi:hypothetical protein